MLKSIGRHSGGDSEAVGQGFDRDVRETGRLEGLSSQMHVEGVHEVVSPRLNGRRAALEKGNSSV